MRADGVAAAGVLPVVGVGEVGDGQHGKALPVLVGQAASRSLAYVARRALGMAIGAR